jgi:glucosamine--fructose-6-phosphate aminotransferase (isomerizing)
MLSYFARELGGLKMCGIFGCVLKDGKAAPLIHQGLRRLEYRGYDSVGFATISNGAVHVGKDEGRIDEVVERLSLDKMHGSVGVGHTRWATHGAPMMVNAHPHTDCEGRVAVIHNGVIENFLELKEELINKGHTFASRTDTEVIPHLIEEEMKGGIELGEAVLKSLRRLEGSYAIAMVSSADPERIYCARNESPLVLGLSEEGTFCASDVPAMLPYTNKVVYLRNGEFATLDREGFQIKRIQDGAPVERELEEVTWSLEMAEKQGYPHFMLKEIYEQPSTLRNALRLQRQYLDLLTAFLDRGRELFLVAAGTSHHACMAASYMFSKLARLTTYPAISSEFVEQYGSSVGIDSVVLAVSQSGETYDTLKAIDHARMRATTVLGVTNTVGSTLTRVSRAYIIQQSGPEIGVAATKTFTSQLMVLSQLALRLARTRGKVSQDEVDDFEAKLLDVPAYVEQVLDRHGQSIRDLAEKYSREKLFVFLGRGISAATALEGRLKLLELTYVPSLAYPAGESKHGPISVVEEGVPIIFLCPRGETRKDIIGSIMEMKARGAKIISVCEEGDKDIMGLSDDVIEMPQGIPELLSPIPYVVPLQLFSYYLAVQKGLDPDKPRNLAKSVTVP